MEFSLVWHSVCLLFLVARLAVLLRQWEGQDVQSVAPATRVIIPIDSYRTRLFRCSLFAKALAIIFVNEWQCCVICDSMET